MQHIFVQRFFLRLFLGLLIITSISVIHTYYPFPYDKFQSITNINIFQDQQNRSTEKIDPADPEKWTLNPVTQTYELGGKPIIWQYWNTDHIPLYVGLLVEALQCRNPEFRTILVHDSTIYKYLPDFKVPKRLFDILIGPHKADLFRVAALAKYGGLYADVDSFALEKFYPIYELLAKYDVVTPKWGDEIFALGEIGPARANLPILQYWHRNQLNAIRAKVDIDDQPSNSSINITRSPKPFPAKDPFGWAELLLMCSRGLDKEILNETKYRGYNGVKTVGQLVAKGLEQSATGSFGQESPKFLPLKWAPVLFLHHSKLKDTYTKVTDLDVLLPPANATLYSTFVGCALMDCWSDFERMATGNESAVTPIAKVNVTALLTALGRTDKSICQKVNARDGLFAAVELNL